MSNKSKLEEIEHQLEVVKQVSFMNPSKKAQMAESIIEKSVYLMRCMVADIEVLKGGE